MHTATELPSSPVRARPSKRRKPPAEAVPVDDRTSLPYLRLCVDRLGPLLEAYKRNKTGPDGSIAHGLFAREALAYSGAFPALIAIAIAEVNRRSAEAEPDPVFAAIAEERATFAEYQACKDAARGRKNEDDLTTAMVVKWDAAEEKVAETVPTTLAGLLASAKWFVAHMEYSPLDAVKETWPRTMRAALEKLAR